MSRSKTGWLLLALALITISLWLNRQVSGQEGQRRAEVEISGTVIHAEVAVTPDERYQGLSGHEPLCADCGLLFIFPDRQERTFVMRGMEFPLDIVFIDHGRISHIAANLPVLAEDQEGPLYPSEGPADRVLEVAAGYAERHDWAVGNEVETNIYED